jgi:hypothetical protein
MTPEEIVDFVKSLRDGQKLANKAIEMFGPEYGDADVALVYALAMRLACRAKDHRDLEEGLVHAQKLLTGAAAAFLRFGKDMDAVIDEVAGHA